MDRFSQSGYPKIAGFSYLLSGSAVTTVQWEKIANATAYNFYVDQIGSWYNPSLGMGTVCTFTSWTDNGDGTLSTTLTLPDDRWILITATNYSGESSAGQNSQGQERMSIGTWENCPLGP